MHRVLSGNKLRVLCVFLALLSTQHAFSMHISEGFLPPFWCLFWAVAALPFIWLSIRFISKRVQMSPKAKILLGIAGAYIFVLSAIKLPSVSGSSSHLTGTGLGVILFGSWAMTSLCVIVLLFQALLLAHGGITTLGANVFSMGIAGPIVALLTYKGLLKIRCNASVAIFLSAMLGNLATYLLTSLQLALAFHDKGFSASLLSFMGLFAITQIPLSIVEGIVTVLVFRFIRKYAFDQTSDFTHYAK